MKENNVMRATTAVMAVTLLSRLLGFVRQSMIASIYGANQTVDIYFTASDFFIGVSAAFTTALTAALVNIYIRVRLNNGEKQANRTASGMMTFYFLFGIAAVGLFVLAAPLLARILAPGYDAAGLAELTKFLRIYSLALIFSGFQSILAAVLNARNSFVPANLYGLIYNPLAIIMMLFGSQNLGIYAVVIAYMIGNLIQLAVMNGFCHGRVRLCVPAFTPEIRQILWLSLPLLLSNILLQCNHVVDKVICNLLGEGMVSAYAYAYALEQFVTAAFSLTVGQVLYSTFTDLAAKGDHDNMQKMLEKALGVLVLILWPVLLVSFIASGDIVRIVYMRGSFTETAAVNTQLALMGFAVGFPIVAVREIYVRVHLAYQNSKRAMTAGAAEVLINTVLSIFLAMVLKERGWGIFGIALATSLSALLSIFLLNRSVRRYLPRFRLMNLRVTFLKILAAGAVCTAVIIVTGKIPCGRLFGFVLQSAAGIGVYIAMLSAMRCEEIHQAARMIKKRFLRKTIE